MRPREEELGATQAKLAEWFQAKMPAAGGLELSPLRRPSAGLSNETFLCELRWREGGAARWEELVVRLEPTRFKVFPEYDLAKQFRVLQCLSGSGVPAPRARWLEEDRSVLGCSFYVMEKIEGELPSEVPPYHAFGICRDASPAGRAEMWWSGVETLARIHALDWRALGLSFLGEEALDGQLAYYERYLRWVSEGTSQPVLETALGWLKANRYRPHRLSFCWGDSRLPNLIFRDHSVVGVLDWEMAFLGDAEADLGWWLFMDWQGSEGYGIPRLEGFPEREETVRRYEELTGRPVEQLLYNETFAAFRFGVIMARVAGYMEEMGIPRPSEDFATNNPCTQRLAALLELPPPGQKRRELTRIEEGVVRVQFHLTGSDGRDWYLVSEGGEGRRHEGTVANPDVTVTATAADWRAIRAGELDRTQAYLGGRLAIEGDMTLLMQLEEMITRLGAE